MIGLRTLCVMLTSGIMSYQYPMFMHADYTCTRMYADKIRAALYTALSVGLADTAADDYQWGKTSYPIYGVLLACTVAIWIWSHGTQHTYDYASAMLEQASIAKNKSRDLLRNKGPELPGGLKVFAEHIRNTSNEEIVYLQKYY